MKKITRLFFFAAMAAAVACNSEALEIDEGETMPDPGPETVPEATLSFSKTEIVIGGSMFDAGEATIKSNQMKFTAVSSETWLTAECEGKILRAIAAQPNDTGAERTAVITVTAGEGDNTATATIDVRQEIRDESSETTILTIADPNAELAAEADSRATVTFETNKTDVRVSVEEGAESWLQAEISGSEVVFTALSQNSTGAIRSAVATVSAGQDDKVLSVNVTVKQNTTAPEDLAVGALYEGGMIFDITDTYIKILSLQEASLAWSTENIEAGTESNPEEGLGNTAILQALTNFATAYPAAKFCTDLGEGWYMPSRKELIALYNNTAGTDAPGVELINSYLESYGGAPIQYESYYLSCCEYSQEKVWAIKVGANKNAYQSNKSTERFVRAVKKILR